MGKTVLVKANSVETKAVLSPPIKRYSCPSLGIGQLLNGVLYLRYGSSSKINTVKRCKTLIDENP